MIPIKTSFSTFAPMNFLSKTLIAAYLLFVPGKLLAQYGGIRYYKEPLPAHCKDCGDTKARFPGKEKDMQSYLRQHADKEVLKRFPFWGKIIIHVLVDTTGTPLCTHIDNAPAINKHYWIDALHFDTIVNNMPQWSVAIDRDGTKHNSSVQIMVSFYNNTFGAEYTDINLEEDAKDMKEGDFSKKLE